LYWDISRDISVDVFRHIIEESLLKGPKRQNEPGLADKEPDIRADIPEVYLAKGVHATTAIEGNTLSEEEVVEHLAGRLRLPPSQAYRAREIDNIVTAYNQIAAELHGDGSRDLTADKIKHYNRLILNGLPVDEGVAIIAHLYLAWIHYFGDGNGRTARCVELQILFATGEVPTPATHLLSNHYNTTRDEYYRQLDAASRQHDGSPIAFRQRQLVLDLSKRSEPVPRSKLRDLSPKVALAYADRGDKTLTRDLNALLGHDLIVAEESGYRPRREKILALLPHTAPPPPESV